MMVAANAGVRLSDALPIVQQVNDHLWTPEQTSRLSGLLNLSVLRPGSNAIYLPTDVTVEGGVVSADGALMKSVFHTHQGATVSAISAEHPLAMSEVSLIGITGSSPERDISAIVTLTINRNGVRFPLELPAVTVSKGATGETRVVQVKPGGVNTNLKQHLNTNRMYYSQAIFRSLDSTQIALLLSGFGLDVNGQTVPVAQVVEPRPIRYVGNYLAFKMNTDAASDETWAAWLERHGIQLGSAKEDIVPLPSGGTFAEAVLGRSNCAEKLDISRFWNWQDSPIPLQPSEIAAIQTGSRATDEDVKPGQLSNPIINITAPTSLPDPAGTAAVLAAIQNGNMFRDMSGLQSTIGLAQAALQATSAGAATAGQQAGTNMNSLLQANTERQRIAAEMITSLAKTAASAYTGGVVGAGGGISGGGVNHSQDGAKINYFDKTQGQTPAGEGNSGNGAVTPVGGGGQSGGGKAGGFSANGTGASGGTGGGGYSQNPAALAATWGDGQPRSGLIDRLVDAFVEPGTDTSASLVSKARWPNLNKAAVYNRINQLKTDANLVDQGALGLCGEACFYHHVIQRDPDKFYSFATALFSGGIGFIGTLKVDPDADLRNADYAAIVAKRGAKSPPIPPQADWMLLSALRDTENEWLDYEGTPEENFAEGSDFSERYPWYQKSNLYQAVIKDGNTDLAHVKTAIVKNVNNHISLWIDVGMISPGDSGGHVIALESPFVIDEPGDKVTFDYWSWGAVSSCTTTVTNFKKTYKGAIIATF